MCFHYIGLCGIVIGITIISLFMLTCSLSQLGSSAILGILEDGHLSANQYNWLSSIFYLGYLLAEWPQNLALQRFPVAKWLSINLIAW